MAQTPKQYTQTDQSNKKNISKPDKSLEADYRPTRYGSTDRDRKKTGGESGNNTKRK